MKWDRSYVFLNKKSPFGPKKQIYFSFYFDMWKANFFLEHF